MLGIDWIHLAVFFVIIFILIKPVGIYLYKVLHSEERTFLDPILKPLEKLFYRISWIDAKKEQNWKQYLASVLGFSSISLLFTFGILAIQYYLPLNPEKFSAPSWDLNVNTSISFMTNTNWQNYGGEKTMSIVGTLLFTFSQNLFLVGLARFISGIMMAFGLITCLKLASRVHPSNKMALTSSLIITIGMVGGMLSSVLMEVFIRYLGWRGALVLIACVGVLIAILLWFIVRLPKEHYEEEKLKKLRSHESIWKSLWIVIKEGQNWYCGPYTCMVNLPLAILGALFGITYLIQIYGIPHLEAASITSMLFLGMIFGSPFFGWISDHFLVRRIPMLLGAISCLILTLVLLYVQDMGIISLFILFFAIGFTSASQVLGYPVITESNHQGVTATALGLASILIMGLGYGLGLPFVGWLLDLDWQGQIKEGVAFYSLGAYRNAFLSIPIGIVIGIIMSILMKETHCKSKIRSEK